MIISIGVLAWNEENSIGAALHSLLEQTLLRELADHAEERLEVVVVPNGCSDHTDEKAAEALRTGAATLPMERFSWRVESLREAGKVNAWNQFVHRLSNQAADFIFLMDADISFTHPDTLKNMVQALVQNPWRRQRSTCRKSIFFLSLAKHLGTVSRWPSDRSPRAPLRN